MPPRPAPRNRVFAYVIRKGGSERHPLLFLGELHVARVDAQPQPRADPDRDQHHVALAQVARGEPAEQVVGLEDVPDVPPAEAVVKVHVLGDANALPATSFTPEIVAVYVVPAARSAAGFNVATLFVLS